MHEIVRALEAQLTEHGCVALDKVQSKHLITWLHLLIMTTEQQDNVIQRLKVMSGIGELPVTREEVASE